MAYQYDAFGNVIGEYESEEERLAREKAQREAAQAQVQKQEVITRADGTQTVKTTQEVSAPPTTPVNPADVFGRMVQVESGGQQFNKSGGILTSPKGAQGLAQIMPATAANPGFGVKPATPEEIATPEGNRAFGERYFQGLLKYFNGDVAKATAAYNGGAGRVERNIQANQGQMNTAQLPKETQDYLQKVLGGVGSAVNAIIPSAQAAEPVQAEPMRIQQGGVPIYAESPKASTITPPAGFQLLSTSQADAKPAGSYYDSSMNAWLAPSGQPVQAAPGLAAPGLGATGDFARTDRSQAPLSLLRLLRLHRPLNKLLL